MASDIGPQRSPASVRQIQAQVKQLNRELEATMIETKERPGEESDDDACEAAISRAFDASKTVTTISYVPASQLADLQRQLADKQAVCERWSADYARQADELMAVKGEQDSLRSQLARQGIEIVALTDQVTLYSDYALLISEAANSTQFSSRLNQLDAIRDLTDKLNNLSNSALLDAISEGDAKEIATLKARLAEVDQQKSDLEGELACCADILNTWARETGTSECHNYTAPLALRNHIDNLWGAVSGQNHKRLAAAEGRVEAMRPKIIPVGEVPPLGTLLAVKHPNVAEWWASGPNLADSVVMEGVIVLCYGIPEFPATTTDKG